MGVKVLVLGVMWRLKREGLKILRRASMVKDGDGKKESVSLRFITN